MSTELQDHPLYDRFKAEGLSDTEIKAKIDQEEEMAEFEQENIDSIKATERAEERMRTGE
jgi:hypothetical protein